MEYKINKRIQCERNCCDEDTGVSYCILHTDIGDFNGFTKIKPEDKNYTSKFLGCKIAEYKAYVRYLKEKRKILQYQIQTLNTLLKIIDNNINDVNNTFLVKREIYFLKKQYEKEKQKISNFINTNNEISKWFEEAKKLKDKYKNKKRT